ncbi:hypothetical protein N7492_006094 [Penicillium capsulatum]|uniref:Uncharacterized protein n=1 Tax=Penicillium capsulatum TaxID=69766 RepID=A0A9W9I2X8_9EURO|nr:hypothetical protein N7492_006094 [Penicillium capsulatum]KAJ6108744.1 hypothetical protein N7512_008581 [Penicillium capsulatum]
MTVWRPHPPAFSFRGVMRPQSRLSDDASRSINNISLPACNATSQNGDWILMLHTLDWPYWLGDWHGFTRPMMVGAFDEHTANLTIVGKFTAYPWLWPNASRYNLGNNHAVSGDIHIRFRGVLDPYHSDVLDVNSSSPAWLRTVGFGNDSRNIGYGEKNSGARLGVGLGFVSIASLVALLGMMVGM